MPYVLGVHLGATATSAAVTGRDGGRWSAPAPFPLGSTGPAVPTVLCKVQDGSYLAGETARRQEPAHHEWVARSFVEHLGEDAPLMVGGEFVAAHRLAAVMIEWVADQVAHRQGRPPDHIAVAHSAAWGPHRTHLLHQALAQLGLNDVTLLPEPVAVGLDYTSRQHLAPDAAIAVGNLGGSGFDATVLRHRTGENSRQDGGSSRPAPGDVEIVGSPLNADHPSGRKLDDEILEYLRGELPTAAVELDPTDPAERATAFGLRAECTRVREALSYQPKAALRVELPGLRRQVELSRARYEQLVRPHLEQVPDLLQQTMQSAALGSQDVEAIVLAGGSARTPLLRQLVTERFHRDEQGGERSYPPPVRVDGAPELVAARGAACHAVNMLSAATDRAASAQETSVLMRIEGAGRDSGELEVVDGDEDAVDDADDADESGDVPRPPVRVEPMHVEPPPVNRKLKILKLSLAAALILFGLFLTFKQGFGGGGSVSPGILNAIDTPGILHAIGP